MRNGTACAILVSTFAVVALCVAPSTAQADAKVKQLIGFYKKEALVCAKYSAGLTSAVERAQPYADDADIAADIKLLTDALVTVQDYCGAIDATLAVLSPNAKYKSVQAEVDRRDAVVRAGRATATQALDDSAPVIRRLVPKVNKLRAAS